MKSSSQADAYPLVSIVIPFYKQEEYLAETLQSIKTDGYPHVEVIVSDDGSPTPADTLVPPGDAIIIRGKNQGPSAARNRGFYKSRGDYLLFLDSDDRLVPGAIQSHVDLLRLQPEAALSFGAIATIDGAGKVVIPPHLCRPRKDYFLKLLEGNMIAAPGAALFRRAPLESAGLFDESFRMAEDYLLYLKLARKHSLLRNERCVLERRIHASGVSQSLEPMLAGTLRALETLAEQETLSPHELRQLGSARKRWKHEYRPRPGLAYKLRSLTYSISSMLHVAPSDYLRKRTY